MMTKEDKLLGGYSPFVTAMRLNIPGFVFALLHAFQDSLDLYFIKKGYGKKGVTVVSISGIVRMLVASFSSCEFQGITKKFSELFAKHDSVAAGDLFVEVFRFNIIYGAIMTTLMLSLSRTLISKMGISDEILTDGQYYLMPISFLPIFVSMIHLTTGVLLAAGRSILYAFSLICVMTISLSFDPLLIYVFKVDLKYIGFAFTAGPSIVSTVLFLLFVFPCFKMLRPRWNAFIKKPSQHFWQLLKLILPSVNTTALGCLNPIIFSILLKKATNSTGNSEKIATVYSTTMKVFQIMVVCINNGLGGLIPSATYALHNKMTQRAVSVVLWCLLLPLVATFSIAIIMIAKPFVILQIWISDKEMIDYVPKISPIPFYTSFLEPFTQSLIALIIVFNRGILASIPPLIKATALLGSAAVFAKYSGKNHLAILHAYNIQDVCNFTFTLLIFIYVLNKYRKEYNNDLTSLMLDTDR